MKSRSFSQAYVKYIVKTPILFYAFLSIGIGIFLYMTLSIQMDVRVTYEAKYEKGDIVFFSSKPVEWEKIYIYKDRNEKVYSVSVDSAVFEDNTATLHIKEADNSAFKELSGDVYVDVTKTTESLFERIFKKAGKGV